MAEKDKSGEEQPATTAPEDRRFEGLQTLTLASAVDGELEDVFGRRMLDAQRVFRECDEYVTDKDGCIAVTIPVEVRLRYHPETGALLHIGSVQHIKRPKVRGAARTAYWIGNSISVKQEIQTELGDLLELEKRGK